MLASFVFVASAFVVPRLGSSASPGAAVRGIAPLPHARSALATMAAPEPPDDLRALFRKHVEERMPLPHAPDGLAHKFLSVTKIGLGLYLAWFGRRHALWCGSVELPPPSAFRKSRVS